MFNGGYLMVSKTDTDLYKKLNNALTLGKPILFYEDATTCYYIDTIALSGDDIVLTKGGKTITITDANVVTESGEVQNHLYVYTFTLQDTNTNDVYFSIFSSKKFNSVIELFEWWKTIESYEFSGFITNSQYNALPLSDFNEAETTYEYYSIYDNETVVETEKPDETTTFTKITQLF